MNVQAAGVAEVVVATNGVGGSASGVPTDIVGPAAARIILLGSVGLYVLVFCTTYEKFTVPLFDYLGLGFDAHWGIAGACVFVAFALLPACFMQTRITRASDLFIFLQYLVIYIPAVFLTYHSRLPVLTSEVRWAVCSSLVAGMMLMVLARNALPVLSLPRPILTPATVWAAIVVCLALALIYLRMLLGGEFQLVGLGDIYSVRDRVTEVLDQKGGRLGGYAFFWANMVFLPLYFSKAACEKKTWLIMLVVCGYLFLFGIWAAKTSLFAPVYLALFYVLLGRSGSRVPFMMCVGLVFLLCVPYLLSAAPSLSLVSDSWVTVVHMRVFSIPSLLVIQYADFFAHHDLTYGSHISGIDSLIHYPYDQDIPRMLGFHYYGDLMTSNVNFWAQDGIAGLGLIGVPIISGIAALVLWLLDAVTAHLPLRFVGGALGGVLLSFLNVSLFTTLVTGGLLLMMLAFWLLPGSAGERLRGA